MLYSRREVMSTLMAAAAAHAAVSDSKLGIPGPFPGRVVAVSSENSIVSGQYQQEIIKNMMHKGMLALTGAPGWADAWRMFVQKGDVVAIKVCPVGGPKLSSDPAVLHMIVDGIKQAGVPARDIVVFNRYRQETVAAGIDKWLPEGVRFAWAAEKYETWQLGMDGYDSDVYMEMALVKPGDNPNDVHARRSYVAQCITKQVNKVINLPVLKSHQSAGVTLCLKNLSHGMVNNVNRSHINRELNACNLFIPAVVDLPVIRQKVVLHVLDGVKAGYNGGPGTPHQFRWEHKTMYFGTDPVALDKIGWQVVEEKRKQEGLPPVAETGPGDRFNHYWGQPQHIELASKLSLGVFDDAKLYDPSTGTFTATGHMTTFRLYQTATLLPDGKVLIAGGLDGESKPLSTAELFDPATGTFTATSDMTTASFFVFPGVPLGRVLHTSTLLPDGTVLVAGGWPNPGKDLASAELYDPLAGTFSSMGGMATGRASHTANHSALRFSEVAGHEVSW